MLDGFKKFILRGNVVDLAVGVVIGGAFGTVVNSMVTDIMTPFISAIFKAPDFSHLSFTIHKSTFMYGNFLNALISFLIIAVVVYFFVITPLHALMERATKHDMPPPPPPQPDTKKCPECAMDIPMAARRCPHCTAVLTENKDKNYIL